MVEYSQITDSRLQVRLEKKYEKEIADLQRLGYRPLAYCLEVLGPYSALQQLPVLLLAFVKGEVLKIQKPFRLGSANMLLSTANPSTVALCMGLGVKFYSLFTDGLLMISSDFQSHAVPHLKSKIVRLPPQPTLEQTWIEHKTQVLHRAGEVDLISGHLTFEDYVKMSTIEEDRSQYL